MDKYVFGVFSGVFSEPTNVELKEGLVVFSVRDLDEILRPIAMYTILNYVWNITRSSEKKRMLVVDEAWNVMQYEDSAKFLFGLVKRARKYGLGVTTITQDVEDFMTNQYGKAIVTNSSIQLLLKQSPASIDVLQNIFKLTEQEKYILLNASVGTGLFFAGSEHV
jgi:type IV secretory pathway VirB4 component